jgi:molybdate/tungstate transport system permease protein
VSRQSRIVSSPFNAALWTLGGLMIVVIALPLVGLLVGVSTSDAIDQSVDRQTADAMLRSVVTASVSTLLLALFGVPLGYLLARRKIRLRPLVVALATLPMAIPGLAGGVLLLASYGPNSPVGSRLGEFGIVLVGTNSGIVLAQCFVASPFVVMASMMAFISIDPKLEAAASTLGDTSWRTFRLVTLPLAWPGIAAGLVLGWMRALGEFGAVMIVAYNPRTLPVHLWVRFESRGLAGALPVAALLVILAGVTVLTWRLLGGLATGPGGRTVQTAVEGDE